MSEIVKNNDFQASIVNFSRSVTPQPTEVRYGTNDDTYVKWGENNLYASTVLKLFSEVPLHRSISLSKVNYLLGDGAVIKATGEAADFDINLVDSFEEVIRKCIMDYVLFNSFALEVQYSVLTHKPIYFNHIPFAHVRMNKPKTKYWVCDDWYNKRNVLSYDRWTKGTSETSKLYVFQNYTPSVSNVYSDVPYKACITEMISEMLIQDLNKGSLEDGFSPSLVLSFFKGVPAPEQAEQFERKLAADFSGPNGKKFLINYNDAGSEKGLQVDTLNATDNVAKIESIKKLNTEAILTAHQATSPLLFGISTEGNSIGGNGNEIEQAFQVFKSVFCKDNRNILEKSFNKIFTDAGFPEIELKDKTNLLNSELPAATLEKVLFIDELRALANLPALPNGDGQKLLTISKTATGEAATNFNEVDDNTEKYKNGRKLTAEDFEQIAHLGNHRSGFTIMSTHKFSKNINLQFDDDNDIENYLLKNTINGKSLSDITADIKNDLGISITADDLSQRIAALTEAKLIESKVVDGVVESTPVKPQTARIVEVLYEYKKRPDVEGDTLLKTSRDFCIRLIENNRIYSREDIQTMSGTFGYDVFTHAGGWWFNSESNKAENQCRHFWSRVRVIRKENNE